MTQTRTRRPTRPHRIIVRMHRSQKVAVAALAALNGLSFDDQLVAMLWGALAK